MSKYIKYMMLLLIIVSSGIFLAGCEKKTDTTDATDDNTVVVTNDNKNTTNNSSKTDPTEDEEDENTDKETEEEKTTTNTGNNNGSTNTGTVADFTKYNSNKQTVGENSTKQYKISSLTNSSFTGYHRFVFDMEGNTANTTQKPKVTAEYAASSNVIKISLDNIVKDSSGIAFQDSLDINKEGIVRIYHNISGNDVVSVYDIGVAKTPVYYLQIADNGTNKWKVTLDVKYPGAVAQTGLDLGTSNTFSQTKQTITGAKAADSAALNRYSYYAANGVLTVVFEVSGSAQKPVPSTYAEYSAGKLNLVFEDLSSCAFGNGFNGELPSVGTINMSKSGNKSTFVFGGVTNKDFKLYGTTNPNQVVLEIKL